jgi:Tetratricopeptide repeat
MSSSSGGSVNKDNLLFATIGLLVGFIAGYLLHELMLARQPLRRPPGEIAAVTAPADPGDAGAGPAGSGMTGGPESGEPQAAAGGPESVSAAGGPDSGATGGSAGSVSAEGGSATGASAGSQPSQAGAANPGAGGPPMAAILKLRERVAAHPDDAEAVLQLGNANYDIQNWGRARDLYLQYLGLRPANPDVLTDLGHCYRQLRQFDRALEQFRRAEQLAPNHWKSLFSETVVLGFDLNQLDAAGRTLARLRAVAPNQPEVTQLAAALERRRQAGGAAR